MKRLPSNFKPALDKIRKSFIYEENMSYSKINKYYRKIDGIFKDNKCEVYDINHLINNYSPNTKYRKTIDNISKLVKDRNNGMIKKVHKNRQWKIFLKDVKSDMNELFIGKINIKDIEDGLVKIMKKYNNNWLGYWSIMDIGDNGSVRSMKLFDMNDYNELKNYLHLKKNYIYKE